MRTQLALSLSTFHAFLASTGAGVQKFKQKAILGILDSVLVFEIRNHEKTSRVFRRVNDINDINEPIRSFPCHGES